jgi:hypothetical protein
MVCTTLSTSDQILAARLDDEECRVTVAKVAPCDLLCGAAASAVSHVRTHTEACLRALSDVTCTIAGLVSQANRVTAPAGVV